MLTPKRAIHKETEKNKLSALTKSHHAKAETNELADILVDFNSEDKESVVLTEEKRVAYCANLYIRLLVHLSHLNRGEKSKNIRIFEKNPTAYLMILEKQGLVTRDKDLRRWYITDTGRELCEYLGS